ncbi:MAG: AarF/ABC1/UbiB kinase family protein [Alphaproteobacteria bacterium]|jgi:predicted unusual protein kinase regulating ubiquinone biosynthesis (AarF/ABC1/UbiB family)|nr:AarF/ABC1/UbiB kinase family protein [Alphaproteobacteria bacterium]
MNDEDSLSARLKRYGQVSTAMGGLAARLVGQKFLGIDIDQPSHAQGLTAVLGTLKGPLMKVAQFLATVPGALPPEYAQTFLSLQMNAPAMGWAFVRRRMVSELGPNWQGRFQEFSHEAVAAASLGQVHRAKDHNGNDLACKLQYPDMASIIRADLGQLKVILSLYETWSQALDTAEVQEEIALRLEEELDYHNEARNIGIYQQIFSEKQSSFGVHIPKVYPDLTTKRLLTLSWMQGESLLKEVEAPLEERNTLARRLFMAWYYPFYHYGVIHGDPHPGNYTARADGELNILDFGCVRIFPPSFIKGVIDLYRALQQDDRDLAVHAYEAWGFQNLNEEMIDIITQWARLLYGPLLDDRVRPIQDLLDGSLGWDTATKVHAELERLGGIRPPKEFVFMDRAAVGIGSVIMRLKAEQNWHQLFESLIENFDVNEVERRQNSALKGKQSPKIG